MVRDPASPSSTSHARAPRAAPDTAPPVRAGSYALAIPAPAERLPALDATRGFALLGITLVNMKLFAGTIAEFFSPTPPDGPLLDRLAHFFVSSFCEAKFFPLYSLLFGIGFGVLLARTAGRGQAPVPAMLRRLFMLGAIGFLHGTLIWYGDILLLYALTGLLLLALSPLSARVLLVLAGVALLISLVATTAFTLLQGLSTSATEPAELPARLAEMPPVSRYWNGMVDSGGKYTMLAMASAETQAFRDGPFLQALLVRISGYGFALFTAPFSYGWSVVCMFILGLALVKLDFFSTRYAGAQRACIWAAALLGLPFAAGATLVGDLSSSLIAQGVNAAGTVIAGPLLAAGWLCVFLRVGDSGRWPRTMGVLARVGRLGLTNYLLMSVLATGVTYHWGLRMFGQVSPFEQVLLAVGLYLLIVGFSLLWTARFAMGPLEWAWRCFTQWRALPLPRSSAPTQETGATAS